MTTLTLDLPPDLYEQLRAEAERLGKPPALIVREWLAERLTPSDPGDRESAREALHAAGLLVELGPEMKERAARSTATLDEISDVLDRSGGKPLSEIILEMRGPKA